MSGVFPTFSADGSQLAFVDNEFKAVWVADSKGLRIVFEVNFEKRELQKGHSKYGLICLLYKSDGIN